METNGTKVRIKSKVRFAFWIVFALIALTTGLLLVAEIFDIWMGPAVYIITSHGPKSGILGGLSALSSGEFGYGVDLLFSGLTRGVPGKINIALFVLLLVLGIYRSWLSKKRGPAVDPPE
ncbi:MAG: hypothetical protein ACE5E0_04930 [Terriglobia bacterium]